MTRERQPGYNQRLALLRRHLVDPQFPRSAAYDLEWQYANAMGPNPLWLVESLCEVMPMQPGMRVLDLGSGRGGTSIFLAKEFGVRVVAADLWVRPEEVWPHVLAAGVEHLVMPLHAEAHDLKFAPDYFDAIVSIDAYHYFGTDDLYLAYILRFLKPAGRLGVVVPSLTEELDDGIVPGRLSDAWDWDFHSFHSPQWWRRHWSKLGKADVERADLLPNGWRHWLRWEQLGAQIADGSWREQCARWANALEADAGRTLGFARVVATKR